MVHFCRNLRWHFLSVNACRDAYLSNFQCLFSCFRLGLAAGLGWNCPLISESSSSPPRQRVMLHKCVVQASILILAYVFSPLLPLTMAISREPRIFLDDLLDLHRKTYQGSRNSALCFIFERERSSGAAAWDMISSPKLHCACLIQHGCQTCKRQKADRIIRPRITGIMWGCELRRGCKLCI